MVSLLDKVRGKPDAEKGKAKKEDDDVLANSILNHQTNSIRQARSLASYSTARRRTSRGHNIESYAYGPDREREREKVKGISHR